MNYLKLHTENQMAVYASNGTNNIVITNFYEDETFTNLKDVKVEYDVPEPEKWEEDKFGHFHNVQVEAENFLETTLTLPQ